MDATLVALSVAIGMAVAAPIGPINLIVMRTSLDRGFWAGIAAGTGSVAGDGLFATVAAFGIRQVQSLVLAHATALSFVSGVLLVGAGLRLARSHVEVAAVRVAVQRDFIHSFAKTFVLTLSNPATLFGMLALFSGLGSALNLAGSPYRPVTALTGVALGSLIWWCIVSGIVAQIRHRLSPAWLDRVDHWAGVAIAASGFLLIFRALFG
jgi:threonine/homoserine/homoserine lactone efflux protein